jgi:hypothetical protein
MGSSRNLTGGGRLGGWLGLPRTVTLRRTSGRGEGNRRSSLARRSTWWGRLLWLGSTPAYQCRWRQRARNGRRRNRGRRARAAQARPRLNRAGGGRGLARTPRPAAAACPDTPGRLPQGSPGCRALWALAGQAAGPGRSGSGRCGSSPRARPR